MTGLPTPAELEHQLGRLIEVRLLDPLEVLLEGDTAVDAVRRKVTAGAARWAAELLGDDGRRARYTAIRLVATLYPGDGPFDPPAEWWATPLGRVVARRAGHPGSTHVSYAVAGAMLGVTRQAVHDLVTRGKLDRDAEGGVTVASVRARLTTREAVR